MARILQSTDIIPQPLLDQFVSMTDSARAQTVDTDIAKHCAYSLPGVALTLGRQNWHCLKDTYETLASDGQLLHEDKRREHLRQLQEFVVTDSSRNWRFRCELAEQLILILELYSASEVHGYLRHVALKLCADSFSSALDFLQAMRTELLSLAGKSIGKMDKNIRMATPCRGECC